MFAFTYRWILRLAIVALVSVFVSCASKPSPTTEEVVEQAMPQETEIPDNWAALAEKAGSVDDGWLKNFKDPKLEALVEEALDQNPGLRIAAANVESAAAVAVIAGAALKPTVAAGAGVEQTHGGSPIDTNSWAVGLSWELDLWGKLRARAAAGEAAYEATVADYQGARQSLAAMTAKTWFLTTEAYRQRALTEENVRINVRMIELAEARYRVGKVSRQDVHLAKADLAAAEERLRKTQIAYGQAARGLEVLLGRYPRADVEVRKNFIPVPPPVPIGLPAELLKRRPDLVAAERRVAVAFQLTVEAEAARLPSVSLTAGGGQASNDFVNLLGVDRNFFSVGANFLAPIYTGGALEAQVQIATADQKAALAAYGQTALTAFSEVETALANERLIEEREVFLEDVVKENSAALKLAQKQYEVGQVDLLSVLIIQARLIGAEAALISIRNDRLANRVNLHLALGGSFEAK
jgi:NodT family efflux transporter outer membrane factor (OMF) lipoprotein